MKSIAIIFYLVFSVFFLHAQGELRDPNIRTIKLYNKGDQTSFPIISVGSIDAMELHFDDLSNRMKNYSYTFQLCNLDWTPSMLHAFEYIKGFQNVRITNYRNSSIATTRYMHYQASLPDRNCYPTRSGNYLLKVFLDNDTSKLVFSRRMVVLDNKVAITGTTLQPFNSTYFRTGQKLTIAVQTDNRIQVMSPNDLKIVILQNNNWQTSTLVDRPTIFRGNYYEYSDEVYNTFSGIKEFRWIDLRSLRLKSDRMEEIDTRKDTTEVLVKPDVHRSGQVYVYYRDLNGSYTIETMESINPYWQGDYAWVHFTYLPPANQLFTGKDLYLFGEVTNYASDTSGKMNLNKETGAYEKTLFLKQGFYNYLYALKPQDGKGQLEFDVTEGNYFATQNSYTVLVYYRPFGARADELVGYAPLQTAFER